VIFVQESLNLMLQQVSVALTEHPMRIKIKTEREIASRSAHTTRTNKMRTFVVVVFPMSTQTVTELQIASMLVQQIFPSKKLESVDATSPMWIVMVTIPLTAETYVLMIGSKLHQVFVVAASLT
jgi:hypothetical protein